MGIAFAVGQSLGGMNVPVAHEAPCMTPPENPQGIITAKSAENLSLLVRC
jgi:hypothetical protein